MSLGKAPPEGRNSRRFAARSPWFVAWPQTWQTP